MSVHVRAQSLIFGICFILWLTEGFAVAQSGAFVASVGNVSGGDTVSTKNVYALAIEGMGLHNFGAELEFSESRNFFDERSPGGKGKIFTLMANVMVAVPVGSSRPYGVFGIGFIRQRRKTSTEGVFENLSDKDFGYNVGGGIIYKLVPAVGVRADLRHFKVRVANGLSFNRFTVGLVLGHI